MPRYTRPNATLIIYSICLLGLLLLAYGAIYLYFHGDVVPQSAKILEEGTKVVITYFLSLLTFAITQTAERMKLYRKVNAVRAQVGKHLSRNKLAFESVTALAIVARDGDLEATIANHRILNDASADTNIAEGALVDIRRVIQQDIEVAEALSPISGLIEDSCAALVRYRNHSTVESFAEFQSTLSKILSSHVE